MDNDIKKNINDIRRKMDELICRDFDNNYAELLELSKELDGMLNHYFKSFAIGHIGNVKE